VIDAVNSRIMANIFKMNHDMSRAMLSLFPNPEVPFYRDSKYKTPESSVFTDTRQS
jgi:hypothetical protein